MDWLELAIAPLPSPPCLRANPSIHAFGSSAWHFHMPSFSDDGDAGYDTALPALTDVPIPYAGCCLALSTPLLHHLHTLLSPTPDFTLSIGSGYGLLEALLLAAPYSLHVIGVEVQPSPNRYLPPSYHKVVSGTRFLHPSAAEAATWLFVYPRRVAIIDEYLEAHGQGHMRTVIWVGPRADWDDYKSCFNEEWQVDVRSADETGGRPWELIAIANKLPRVHEKA